MDQVIGEVLIAIFSRGHGLLEGVAIPLRPSWSVRSPDSFLIVQTNPVHPGLMPSDITGSSFADDPETHERKFMFIKDRSFQTLCLQMKSPTLPRLRHSLRPCRKNRVGWR